MNTYTVTIISNGTTRRLEIEGQNSGQARRKAVLSVWLYVSDNYQVFAELKTRAVQPKHFFN